MRSGTENFKLDVMKETAKEMLDLIQSAQHDETVSYNAVIAMVKAYSDRIIRTANYNMTTFNK